MMRELERLIGGEVAVQVEGLQPHWAVFGTLVGATPGVIQVAAEDPGPNEPIVTAIPWGRVIAIQVHEMPQPTVTGRGDDDA